MAVRHGVDTCNWPALAVRLGARRFGPPASPLDFSARSWPHLLLGVFLAGISDSRIDWAARNSSCRRIPAGGGGAIWPRGLLVCADAAVVFEQCSRACRNLLGGDDCVAAAGFEFVAARDAGNLFRVLSFFCECGAGVFRLPIGWNVAGGGIYRDVFRAGRFSAGVGEESRPSRASLFLLVWEGFRIYFESGIAKIMGGDPQWRNFTALDEYYQNGPLPTWIGWYMQHLPHGFHAAMSFGTLALELVLAWMMFLPRRIRIVCFFIVTPWQIGIILSANYTFLNYLVLVLGFLLLDDQFVLPYLPRFMKESYLATKEAKPLAAPIPENKWRKKFREQFSALKLALTAVMLTWIYYVTLAEMVWMVKPLPLPTSPVSALEPFRIANRYGLFAVMTRGRFEIEFQGSDDGQTWLVYPFRFKPQDPSKAPGIYAPYQPRFDWNLWFASLSSWRQEPIVVRTEQSLLRGDADVLLLFAGNPFPHARPRQVRAVVWQYWFATPDEKRLR